MNQFPRLLTLTMVCLGFSACATTRAPAPIETNPSETNPAVSNPAYIPPVTPSNDIPIIVTLPDEPPRPAPVPAPRPLPPAPPADDIVIYPSAYENLPYWSSADMGPALSAFLKGCAVMDKGSDENYLNPNLPTYGQYKDWRVPCIVAGTLPGGAGAADNAQVRQFFEDYFTPIDASTRSQREGLLTGYYEPEIEVRSAPSAEFSEPILSRPTSPAGQALPRSMISSQTSRVIAWGRPIDVFFMQIQGSGRIRLDNGRVVRAAFNGHNGRKYVSIGRVLVDRGEMTLEQASKDSIEAWMNTHTIREVRELMHQNPRYVFFKAENINGGEGPKGAMRVPLTGMGSIAVDPRYHPYGTPYWLETTLPTYPGDYTGSPTGQLVVAQDTGGAIKGPLRADLFFGSGDYAGRLAGVLKHPVQWTILLPTSLVDRMANIRS